MTEERRKEQRLALSRPPRGEISVVLAGRELAVLGVIDVSPRGIALLLDEAIAIGVALEVRYRNDVVDLRLPGSPIWARAHEAAGGGYAIGIELAYPALLHAFL